TRRGFGLAFALGAGLLLAGAGAAGAGVLMGAGEESGASAAMGAGAKSSRPNPSGLSSIDGAGSLLDGPLRSDIKSSSIETLLLSGSFYHNLVQDAHARRVGNWIKPILSVWIGELIAC